MTGTETEGDGSELERFWDQTWGKTVLPVDTMLDDQRQYVPRSRAASPDARVLAAIQDARPADVVRLGTPSERAAACLHEVVRIRRLTPSEAYAAHRSYPSARGLGATTATLLTGGRTGPSIRLQPTPARVPAAYGSLREPLALLEVGHQAANLQLVGATAGLSPALTTPTAGASENPLTQVHVRFGLPSSSKPGQQLHAEAVGSELPLRVLFDRRTSNPTPSLRLDRGDLDSQATSLQSVGRLALLSLEGHWPEAAVPAVRLVRRRTPAGTSTDLVWVADVRRWVSSGTSVDSLYIAVGWLSQWLCLAAAAQDLAVRPMKAFDEADFSSALRSAPDEQPLYLLRVERRVSSPFERILR